MGLLNTRCVMRTCITLAIHSLMAKAEWDSDDWERRVARISVGLPASSENSTDYSLPIYRGKMWFNKRTDYALTIIKYVCTGVFFLALAGCASTALWRSYSVAALPSIASPLKE